MPVDFKKLFLIFKKTIIAIVLMVNCMYFSVKIHVRRFRVYKHKKYD